MTREEAIKMLKSKMDGHTDTSYEWVETVRMAIKALEQDTCEDEYIKVPKKALKYRTTGMVAYNVEWLKSHFDMERVIVCGEKEPKTEWISVSERLPNFAGTYLVTRYFPNNVMNPTYLVDACFFDGSNTWHNDNRINHERAYVDNVIAWQEDPEPYKESEG